MEVYLLFSFLLGKSFMGNVNTIFVPSCSNIFFHSLSSQVQILKGNLKYLNTYCHVCGVILQEKVKFELFMIYESYVKESFGGYVFIGIWLSSILESILENYGYGVDLALFDDE